MTQRNSAVWRYRTSLALCGTRDSGAADSPASCVPLTGKRASFAIGLLLLVSGCVTPWERSALEGPRAGIDNIQGPTERRLRNLLARKTDEDDSFDVSGTLKPIAGTEEYLAAEETYEAGEYKQAEREFKAVAKKFKKSDIREDALFMQAESAFQQKHYADANDLYAELVKAYPSSRHLDDVTKRLFEIARTWLDFPETAKLNEVEQVNYDNFHEPKPAETPFDKKRTPVYVPNFFDEGRPVFDTEGNAISALRLIWLNDPTGPLADDALMMTASHYSRRGNYIEADRHYTLLREEYPNSPHVQTAFVLGSHVKLMAYQGPQYDGKALQDAEHLKESTLRLYPASEDRQRLEGELQKIEEAKAAREWELVEFYDRKRNPRAQAVYCHLILERFPETSYAKRSRERLQKLGPEYASGAKLLSPYPDPKQQFWAEPGSAFKRKVPPTEQVEGPQEPKPSFWAPPGSAFQRKTPTAKDTEATPDDSAIDEPTAPEKAPRPPRRLWFAPQEKPETIEEPESPGEMESVPRGELASDEENAEKSSSRLGRMFRFSPPRRLNTDDEAKPNTTEADSETDSGKAKL